MLNAHVQSTLYQQHGTPCLQGNTLHSVLIETESDEECNNTLQQATSTATERALYILTTPNPHELVEDNYATWRRCLEI